MHRVLQTNVTFTITKPQDFRYCSYIFRENITADQYIYYEEVTRDMPGFQNWPHGKKMDIEAPTSISKEFEFIWKLPFSERKTNSYIKNYVASSEDTS